MTKKVLTNVEVKFLYRKRSSYQKIEVLRSLALGHMRVRQKFYTQLEQQRTLYLQKKSSQYFLLHLLVL